MSASRRFGRCCASASCPPTCGAFAQSLGILWRQKSGLWHRGRADFGWTGAVNAAFGAVGCTLHSAGLSTCVADSEMAEGRHTRAAWCKKWLLQCNEPRWVVQELLDKYFTPANTRSALQAVQRALDQTPLSGWLQDSTAAKPSTSSSSQADSAPRSSAGESHALLSGMQTLRLYVPLESCWL